jgi:hypothetical protein
MRQYPGGNDVAPRRVALSARVSTRAGAQVPELQLRPLREDAAVRCWQTAEHVDHAPAADLSGPTAWARV